MKNILFSLLAIVLLNVGFSQVKKPQKKVVKHNLVTKRIPVVKEQPSLTYGTYKINQFYKIDKKSLSKKEVNVLLSSQFELSEKEIKSTYFENIKFNVYEVETMAKADYLYRVFKRIVEVSIPELTEKFKVHKVEVTNLFGIVQLPNNHIAFPYKGGLIIAEHFK